MDGLATQPMLTWLSTIEILRKALPCTRNSIAVIEFATVRPPSCGLFPYHVSQCLFFLESTNFQKTYLHPIRQYSLRTASNVVAD
jgi:hypothetical protein